MRVAKHKVGQLNSHTGEVCGLSYRDDGAALASGANDNLLNIWDVRMTDAPKYTKTAHTAAVKAIAWCPWQLNLLSSGGGSNDRRMSPGLANPPMHRHPLLEHVHGRTGQLDRHGLPGHLADLVPRVQGDPLDARVPGQPAVAVVLPESGKDL